MWLFLGENISKTFSFNKDYDFLIDIKNINFLIGKNNSGKSYLLRFLLKNTVSIYENKEEIIKTIIQDNDKFALTFEMISNFKNEIILKIHEKYNSLYNQLESIEKNKIPTTGIYSNGQKLYNYKNIDDLFLSSKDLLIFLNINHINKNSASQNFNFEIIPKSNEIKSKISKTFKDEFLDALNLLEDFEIYKLGKILNKIHNSYSSIQITPFKFYIPIFRSIRHPLKDINLKNITEETKDIYKDRLISEYKFNKDNINIITGLDFYNSYKSNLLGDKNKREKINKFERFLSEYFFKNKNLSIIPDEETFELKINIDNEDQDRFIFEVGDGISSLLIIIYTLYMESSSSNYKIFFIEEPEISFHPGFQRLLINIITYVKEFKKCIFVFSTHSNHLINIANREYQNASILLCKKDNSTIKIEETTDNYYEILDELGVDASSVQIANKVIWVEGKYDALYIRLLLNLKNSNNNDTHKKYIEDYDYCFLSYGGSNMKLIKFDSKNSLESNQEFVSKAESINNKFLIILDDDNMDKQKTSKKYLNYKKLKEELKNKIYKLDVREIENLFPEKVLKNFIVKGVTNDIKDSITNDLNISYNIYKNEKLALYINKILKKIFPNKNLKEITNRVDGFSNKNFLYDKNKFYTCVLEWTKTDEFDYEKDITLEAKKLIDTIENFIKD